MHAIAATYITLHVVAMWKNCLLMAFIKAVHNCYVNWLSDCDSYSIYLNNTEQARAWNFDHYIQNSLPQITSF